MRAYLCKTVACVRGDLRRTTYIAITEHTGIVIYRRWGLRAMDFPRTFLTNKHLEMELVAKPPYSEGVQILDRI